jgi:mannitol/fructose-specific phosphotransferase system IIA component (Ntr-type)
MNLTFKNEQIIPKLNGATAYRVIDELVNYLVAIREILLESKETIALAIKRRERSMSTGIGFGIAIPHADTDSIKNAPRTS